MYKVTGTSKQIWSVVCTVSPMTTWASFAPEPHQAEAVAVPATPVIALWESS